MKQVFAFLAVAVALVGCRTHYDIILNNNNRIENVSRPKLDADAGVYRFKMSNGEERTVKAMRVRVIEPHGDSQEPKFRPPSQR